MIQLVSISFRHSTSGLCVLGRIAAGLLSLRRLAHPEYAAARMSTSSPPVISSTASTSSTNAAAEGSGDGWRKSRIYTRTGDTGTTSLYNMQRKCKAEDFFQALGTVDEVNSQLGSVSRPTSTVAAVCETRSGAVIDHWFDCVSGVAVWCASTA